MVVGTGEGAAARRGLMLVLSSPSGAGKSTLARKLLDTDKDIALSISVTTRKRRASEVDGSDYRFITPERFAQMRDDGGLLEWAEVHGNFYGTPRASVEAMLAQGRDVLFDIDWQGTRQLAEKRPDDVVRVFILPPSMRELRARLERRAEDDAATIERRLANARHEIERWQDYDYVIVNEDIQRSLEIVEEVLEAERAKRRSDGGEAADGHRRERNPALADHVASLLGDSA